MTQAYLVLEDGTVFAGQAWGAKGLTSADLAVSTRMTGYQDVLSDPAHAHSIVMMTAPHIGNVGVNSEVSRTFVAQGIIVREPARRPSNWKSEGSLEDALIAQGIIGISGIDTRAVMLHLREKGGALRCAIVSGEALPATISTTDSDIATAVIQVAAAAILSTHRDDTSTGQERH